MALAAIPEWRDKMAGQQQVEDEFTCPGVLQGPLLSLKPTVERVFGVTLRTGGEDISYSSQDGQIWLHLNGRKEEVEAAKLFIKGIVNQEAQKEVQYPHVLHCVFCGAKGLFIDCLVKNTSAHIVVGSVGCLLISGLAEPVVKAYSLVIDLVDKYSTSQTRSSEARSESMDSRLAFKSLVERLEDSHTLELLVLPVMVKEVLLDLVKQSGLDPNTLDSGVVLVGPTQPLTPQERVDRLMLREFKEKQNLDILNSATNFHRENGTPFNNFEDYRPNDTGKQDDQTESPTPFFRSFMPGTEPRPMAASANVKKKGSIVQKWSEGVPLDREEEEESNFEDQHGENLLSTTSKQENEHLLKFFTAMGFNDEVVCRVLARTGPREPSQVLDLIQQEQDKTMTQIIKQEVNGAPKARNEDFVLGVMKKAAASCGYMEDKVAEIYSNLPELKPHELILELQKKEMREASARKESNSMNTEEIEEQGRNAPIVRRDKESPLKEKKKTARIIEKSGMTNIGKSDNEKRVSSEGVPKKKQDVETHEQGRSNVGQRTPAHLTERDKKDLASSKPDIFLSSRNQPPFYTNLPSVCGPPQPTYPSPLYTKISEENSNPVEPTFHKPKHKPLPNKAGTVITGQQRFLEGLETPFVLQLKDDHGDPGLRQIIIDGSNVAMTHGLGIFFSCRGIALAVEYFWNQGHRKITAFVPQWRQKKDPKIKEQHFMAQLQDLGLLSFTPSREVEGQRINSYDDRFMLQLARQTDGVIVTNDNMRDLVDESVGWREIIKTRLLQYVFAGDLFMVPDDPLGRSGPHIKDFLRTQTRAPVPGSHTFAGMPSNFPQPSHQPRAQTEVLKYRERTPGGISKTHCSLRSPYQGRKEIERSAEETLRLKQDLVQIFPGQESVITMTLQCYPALTDINQLSDFILEQVNTKG
ncbi:NEDD4-binding protein 1 isoform 1-T3 [Clarias gariepinus]|uniref:protein KHNYN n=1 Tax=Clarias gariepinus TaxID=13013 RepID=UPI00234D54D5|nr:protein KHNYN [Clarias gariepinus]XP_053335609.1 protein KHNYN [Clarias gariepinus]XP_053335610.1 protein KHNYN [Clarias gariepinus]XP_053335611.1 protein KHNYN [Clarias gariepinus]